MSLADRFKNEMNKKDILDGACVQKTVPSQSTIPELMQNAVLKELRDKIIEKVRKTPYWSDYSSMARENMLSKYLDCKIKKENYNINNKSEFIKDILTNI